MFHALILFIIQFSALTHFTLFFDLQKKKFLPDLIDSLEKTPATFHTGVGPNLLDLAWRTGFVALRWLSLVGFRSDVA